MPATNRMARALLTDFDALRPRERNYARWMFLTDEARNLFLSEGPGRRFGGLSGLAHSQSCSRAYRAASCRVRVWVFCIALER